VGLGRRDGEGWEVGEGLGVVCVGVGVVGAGADGAGAPSLSAAERWLAELPPEPGAATATVPSRRTADTAVTPTLIRSRSGDPHAARGARIHHPTTQAAIWNHPGNARKRGHTRLAKGVSRREADAR
jgi:hypothetical protein